MRRIIRKILLTNLWLGPFYLGKVDLANAYMRLWFCLEDTPSVLFLVLQKKPNDAQLVVFHLSLPMGYVYSAPFFCMSTDKIVGMANVYMGNRHHAPPHPIDKLVDTQSPKEWVPNPNDDEQWT